MRYCFDLDGTLCDTLEGDYTNSKPLYKRIKMVNSIYEQGHSIIIETARGSVTGKDWFKLTKTQLEKWGIKYHELRTGTKKYADFYIDDKAINDNQFFEDV